LALAFQVEPAFTPLLRTFLFFFFALANAPDQRDEMFRVKAIFEE
jgi:hypothetical protein